MKKVLYIILIIGTAGISSCKKNLDALPSGQLVSGGVVLDQKSAEVALNGAYARLAAASSTSTGFHATHEYIPSCLMGWIVLGSGVENNMSALNYALYSSVTTGFWGYSYSLLNSANAVINETGALADNKFTGNRKNEILAEARFLRAFGHYTLLAYHSEWRTINSSFGVLLRKKALGFDEISGTRSTVKESYDYIIKDLDYAIANAPVVRPKHYANQTAAKMLKLRVLMMRGQGTDYADAVTLADDVIDDGNALETNLKDLFHSKGITSSEVILGIIPQPAQTSKLRWYQFVQSSTNIASHYFRSLFTTTNDPRKDWMYKPVSVVPTPPSPPASIRDSFYIAKYIGTGTAVNAKVEDAYVFRLTEAYLTKAEALVRSGGSMTDAKNILKLIEGKAGVTTFSPIDNANTVDGLLREIHREFSRNLSIESGADWLSLLRFPFATIRQIRPAYTDEFELVLPVPLAELQKNPAFGPQNPGWPAQFRP